MNRDSFVIEISSEQQSNKVRTINKISNIAISMSEYFQDMSMGLLYIYEYDLVDFGEFRAGLMTAYNLKDVQQATWIKPRNLSSKLLILTFKEKCLPEYIEISGEQAKTKVYEYISSPLMCQGCLDFGHTKKNYKRNITICGRCNGADHTSRHCSSGTVECRHCYEDHPIKSNKCSIYKYEK